MIGGTKMNTNLNNLTLVINCVPYATIDLELKTEIYQMETIDAVVVNLNPYKYQENDKVNVSIIHDGEMIYSHEMIIDYIQKGFKETSNRIELENYIHIVFVSAYVKGEVNE